MWSRIFAGYVLVELVAFFALAHFTGFGIALLVLLAISVVGLVAVSSQGTRVVRDLRESFSHGSLADGALLAAGTALLIVPGLVTGVLGLLLVLRPTRALLRPVVTAVVGKRIAASPLLVATQQQRGPRKYQGTVIDGEVVDG